MDEARAREPQPTGIEGASSVFAAGAFLNVGLALALLRFGWLGEVGGLRFLFLGLGLAAVAVVTATVALAIGPHRGAPARKAWRAIGASLLLVAVAMLWLLPSLLETETVS